MSKTDMKPCQVGEVLRKYDEIVEQMQQTAYMLGRATLAGQDATELAKGLGELTKIRDEFVRRTVWTKERLI